MMCDACLFYHDNHQVVTGAEALTTAMYEVNPIVQEVSQVEEYIKQINKAIQDSKLNSKNLLIQ